jgi:hypothetical protein
LIGFMRAHTRIRTHGSGQTTGSFTRTVGVEGAGTTVTGHQGSEQAHSCHAMSSRSSPISRDKRMVPCSENERDLLMYKYKF